MIKTGLCSISFRSKTIDEIISLCLRAEIHGIEWGSDVHVPVGEFKLAKAVGEKTRKAGLEVCSYGSYYKCNSKDAAFIDYIKTASELGAPSIRIWAGEKGSEEANETYRNEVVKSIKAAITLATENGISVALEYHGETLTDTIESTIRLVSDVNDKNLNLYWQPRTSGSAERDLSELHTLLPYISNIHCFNWGPGGWHERLPLQQGSDKWRAFLNMLKDKKGVHFALLEFIKDDSEIQFINDAKTLTSLLNEQGSSEVNPPYSY